MRAFNLSLVMVCGLVSGLVPEAVGAPDLVCSDIVGASSFGAVDGVAAYSFGTTVCNVGDVNLLWEADTALHPVISQSIYRVMGGEIQQIGIGFVRHATIPLQSNGCGMGCSPTPGFEMLGVGCSTSSSAFVNGAQGLMGPRLEVNAFTGNIAHPFTATGVVGDAVYKRIHVKESDLNLPGALYFVETQVVLSDEAGHGTSGNNASYRPVMFAADGTATLVGSTSVGRAAIYAWADHGLGMNVPDPSVMIEMMEIPGDGIVFVGSSRGSSHYRYAVENLSSALGVGSFRIPNAGDGRAAFPSDRVFYGVDYHDDLDELISGMDWVEESAGTSVYWNTESFAENELGNAIRWGTMYSFSVQTFRPAMNGAVELGMFGPGGVESVMVSAVVPETDTCLADLNGDGVLDIFDVSRFLSDRNDINSDGEFDFFDVAAFLQAYAAGCG